MAGVAECGLADGPGSASYSDAGTQTDIPACCGSFITSLIRQLAFTQSKLPPNEWLWPAVTGALPSAAPAADPEVAEQTGTGAAGQTELADDNTLEQGPDDEPQALASDQPVTDTSIQRSASEASQEAQSVPRTDSTMKAPQLVYDEDLAVKIEDFNLPEGDASQQAPAPEPDGQTTPEAGRSGADVSPAVLGPSWPVRTRRKRCCSPPAPPEPVQRLRRSSRKQKTTATSEHSAGSRSSAPADDLAANPQLQPPRTAHRRPTSAGYTADTGTVGAQPHAGSRSHCCPQCGKSFPTRRDCLHHELTHTGKGPFACEECGQKFTRNFSLITHRRTHTGEQPYSCKDCGRKFNRRGNLSSHRRVHTGDQPFSCEECGQKFSVKRNLNRHRRIHTGERPFSCEVCGQKYSLQNHLIRHRRTHTGEQPFSCEECGQKFSHQSSLVYHHRTHTGERPYSCEECEKTFRDLSNLIKHRRSHTGEQPFSCRECGRKFSEQSSLTKHLSTHFDKWPFVFCSCGRKFSPQTAVSNSSTERQLQCAACKGSAALKEQAPPQPPPPVPVKQEPPEPEQSTDLLATTANLTAGAGPSTASTGLAGRVDLQTASVSYGGLVGISAGSMPACNQPGRYRTPQDLPSSSLRDLSYRGKVSSQQKKSSKNTAPRCRRISDFLVRDESPVERRVNPARSVKQQNSVQTKNLESQGSGESSDTDEVEIDWSGSECSWRDSSAESSEEG